MTHTPANSQDGGPMPLAGSGLPTIVLPASPFQTRAHHPPTPTPAVALAVAQRPAPAPATGFAGETKPATPRRTTDPAAARSRPLVERRRATADRRNVDRGTGDRRRLWTSPNLVAPEHGPADPRPLGPPPIVVDGPVRPIDARMPQLPPVFEQVNPSPPAPPTQHSPAPAPPSPTPTQPSVPAPTGSANALLPPPVAAVVGSPAAWFAAGPATTSPGTATPHQGGSRPIEAGLLIWNGTAEGEFAMVPLLGEPNLDPTTGHRQRRGRSRAHSRAATGLKRLGMVAASAGVGIGAALLIDQLSR